MNSQAFHEKPLDFVFSLFLHLVLGFFFLFQLALYALVFLLFWGAIGGAAYLLLELLVPGL